MLAQGSNESQRGSGLQDMAVMLTAKIRHYYLAPVLESWRLARGSAGLPFRIQLGPGPRERYLREVISFSPLDITVCPDKEPRGLHHAIAEGISGCFASTDVNFVVASEEDVLVGSDVLELMAWAKEEFAGDDRVLAVLAHNRGGQGWDNPFPAQDAGADPEVVRLEPYFNAWCWGTWADRWASVLEPAWDHDCTSGGPMDSGYDWNIATRVIPGTGLVCVVPEASRTQNIGRLEGWASSEASFSFSQAQSFLAERDPVKYRLVTG